MLKASSIGLQDHFEDFVQAWQYLQDWSSRPYNMFFHMFFHVEYNMLYTKLLHTSTLPIFQRIFICFNGSATRFVEGCSIFQGFDGCHLK